MSSGSPRRRFTNRWQAQSLLTPSLGVAEPVQAATRLLHRRAPCLIDLETKSTLLLAAAAPPPLRRGDRPPVIEARSASSRFQLDADTVAVGVRSAVTRCSSPRWRRLGGTESRRCSSGDWGLWVSLPSMYRAFVGNSLRTGNCFTAVWQLLCSPLCGN
jgi:hypothetical protein